MLENMSMKEGVEVPVVVWSAPAAAPNPCVALLA
jgi:hypothetical protein